MKYASEKKQKEVVTDKLVMSLKKLQLDDELVQVKPLVHIAIINNDNQILTYRLSGGVTDLLTIPVSQAVMRQDVWQHPDKRPYAIANHAKKTLLKMFGMAIFKVRHLSADSVVIRTDDGNEEVQYYNIGESYINKISELSYVDVTDVVGYAKLNKMVVSKQLEHVIKGLENLDDKARYTSFY